MGKGLTNELKAAFPYLIPANELEISNLTLSPYLIIDPCLLAGFILFFFKLAEGSFIISIHPSRFTFLFTYITYM